MVKTPGSRKFIATKKVQRSGGFVVAQKQACDCCGATRKEIASEVKGGSSNLMQQKFMGGTEHDATAALYNSAISLPLA
jgi:hypothetical protein